MRTAGRAQDLVINRPGSFIPLPSSFALSLYSSSRSDSEEALWPVGTGRYDAIILGILLVSRAVYLFAVSFKTTRSWWHCNYTRIVTC